jgi:hypothetical protein
MPHMLLAGWLCRALAGFVLVSGQSVFLCFRSVFGIVNE